MTNEEFSKLAPGDMVELATNWDIVEVVLVEPSMGKGVVQYDSGHRVLVRRADILGKVSASQTGLPSPVVYAHPTGAQLGFVAQEAEEIDEPGEEVDVENLSFDEEIELVSGMRARFRYRRSPDSVMVVAEGGGLQFEIPNSDILRVVRPETVTATPKCNCGASHVGIPHSDWCWLESGVP